MNINTGGRYENMAGPAVDGTGPSGNTNKVLYDDTIAVTRSVPFEVPEGHYAVVIGYNLENVEGAKFRIDGVTLGSQKVASGGACCSGRENRENRASTVATVLFREPMRLGGADWEVTRANNRVVIAVPGWYVTELNSEDNVGAGIQLEYYLVKQSLQLPDVYFPGIKGA